MLQVYRHTRNLCTLTLLLCFMSCGGSSGLVPKTIDGKTLAQIEFGDGYIAIGSRYVAIYEMNFSRVSIFDFDGRLKRRVSVNSDIKGIQVGRTGVMLLFHTSGEQGWGKWISLEGGKDSLDLPLAVKDPKKDWLLYSMGDSDWFWIPGLVYHGGSGTTVSRDSSASLFDFILSPEDQSMLAWSGDSAIRLYDDGRYEWFAEPGDGLFAGARFLIRYELGASSVNGIDLLHDQAFSVDIDGPIVDVTSDALGHRFAVVSSKQLVWLDDPSKDPNDAFIHRDVTGTTLGVEIGPDHEWFFLQQTDLTGKFIYSDVDQTETFVNFNRPLTDLEDWPHAATTVEELVCDPDNPEQLEWNCNDVAIIALPPDEEEGEYGEILFGGPDYIWHGRYMTAETGYVSLYERPLDFRWRRDCGLVDAEVCVEIGREGTPIAALLLEVESDDRCSRCNRIVFLGDLVDHIPQKLPAHRVRVRTEKSSGAVRLVVEDIFGLWNYRLRPEYEFFTMPPGSSLGALFNTTSEIEFIATGLGANSRGTQSVGLVHHQRRIGRRIANLAIASGTTYWAAGLAAASGGFVTALDMYEYSKVYTWTAMRDYLE